MMSLTTNNYREINFSNASELKAPFFSYYFSNIFMSTSEQIGLDLESFVSRLKHFFPSELFFCGNFFGHLMNKKSRKITTLLF